MEGLLTREEMDILKQNNFDQYKIEISKDWTTREEDIAKVKAIIASFDSDDAQKHFQLGGKDFPLWAVDAYHYFEAKYGSQYGSVILEKVLSTIWSDIPQSL